MSETGNGAAGRKPERARPHRPAAVGGRTHFGYGLRQYATPSGLLGQLAERRGLGLPPPDPAFVDDGAPVPARVHRDKWIVDCPTEGCYDAPRSSGPMSLYMCASCFNEEVEGRWRRVAVPPPGQRAQLERVLGRRVLPEHRNWHPGETPEVLRAQNRERGEPDGSEEALMLYVTPDTAITGDFITAADGNRRRDNDEYFKGRAGGVTIENSVAVAGSLSTTAGFNVTGRGRLNNGGDGAAGLWYAHGGVDRHFVGLDDGTEDWYRVYGSGTGNIERWNRTNGAKTITDVVDNHLWPGRLHQTTLTGFLRAGTWTYAYNGDGTIASQAMSGTGPLNGCAITYEYSGGRIVAQRLRLGGTGGTVIASIGYGYDGAGRINSESHS